MFYSETLLSKTGPLARVWLSANLERKLSKTHILQSNIENSVSAIVDQGQAPMALRLSGQLLLGVVRIYSRKARYLLDDCNEALMKIKMAFRPGNVDLPANQLNAPHPASLTLPDVLTEIDLFQPLPDPTLLLTQTTASAPGFNVDHARVGRNEDITLMDMSSQVMQASEEQGRHGMGEPSMLDDIDLDIDIGPDPMGPPGDDTTFEVGRDAPAARPIEDDLLSEFGIGKPTAADQDGDALMADPANTTFQDDGPSRFNFAGDDEFDIGMGMIFNTDDPLPHTAPTPGVTARRSESPLSSAPSEAGQEAAHRPHTHLDSSTFEPMDETTESVHQAQRVRKRRVIQPDADTVLHSGQIKEQQEDRSRILKPASFLPRDPVILTLMEMQRNGGFVSSILGDGRAKGWAPQLKGVLSLEVIRRSGELKRKRDSGIADMDGPEETSPHAGKQVRIELPDDEDAHFAVDGPSIGGDTTLGGVGEVLNLPADDGLGLPGLNDLDDGMPRLADDDDAPSPTAENFDDTVAPLVHPADSGPVSLGTKHAVHLLRDRFGAAAADSSMEQKKAHVLFQDLLPERSTSKVDATKMFFEVLVLATKDAVKVEQAEGVLGGPIRVRGKRGLWGTWAEEEAGGEIAAQEEAGQAVPVTA
ncbi:MAG: sister chromatid cohesion protein 1 [Thelocarpon superellum]|nr:MAG: sister chromatid cohesion protein 1 [Thelocarpon superellum]